MGVLCNFPSFSLLDPFSAHDLGMQYASVKLCFQLFPVLYQTFLGYVIIMQWRPHDLYFHFVEYAFISFNRIPVWMNICIQYYFLQPCYLNFVTTYHLNWKQHVVPSTTYTYLRIAFVSWVLVLQKYDITCKKYRLCEVSTQVQIKKYLSVIL